MAIPSHPTALTLTLLLKSSSLLYLPRAHRWTTEVSLTGFFLGEVKQEVNIKEEPVDEIKVETEEQPPPDPEKKAALMQCFFLGRRKK